MAITYSWKVTGMNTKNEGVHENAVIRVYWTKTGVNEDGVEGYCAGESKFSASEIPADKFVPFEELTEEIVLDWIKSTINEAYHEGIDEQIQKMIDSKLNPVVNRGLPWEPRVEPVLPENSPETTPDSV